MLSIYNNNISENLPMRSCRLYHCVGQSHH